MELKNRSVIVTGGAGGIGGALALALVARNCIVAVFDRDAERIQALRSSIPRGREGAVYFYHVDVGDCVAVERSVQDFFEHRGTLDALVNSAAVLADGCLLSIHDGRLRKYSIEAWQETLNTNLSGVFYCTREVVERMIRKRTNGVIVNVSSISSSGNLGQTSYAASKGALNALTVTWAQELAMYGIRVAGVSPGMTDTPMPHSAMDSSLLRRWIEKTPLKRMATPMEIAHGIIFILENDFFCGRLLELDGGLRM